MQNKKDLQFISDRDARAAGGLHPQAHLWDNGENAVDELKNVMKVRQKALAQFGEKNIREGMPMAMLEDVLVPVYLYHRYQLEAATKMVGGMNYTYALRGDGQLVTKPLTKAEQLNALNAVIECIDPNVLLIPDRITSLFHRDLQDMILQENFSRKEQGLHLMHCRRRKQLPIFRCHFYSIPNAEPHGGIQCTERRAGIG